MKRSNLTLILTVFVSVLLIALIPVLYNAELSKVRSAGETAYSKRSYGNATVIKLVKVKNAMIVPFDSVIVKFKKPFADNVITETNGDTLLVTGDGPVVVFTGKRDIIAVESNFLVKGDIRRFDGYSMTLNLKNSHMYSEPISQDSKLPQYLEDFRITDDGSSVVDLNGRFDIGHLYLTNVREFNCSSEVGLRDTDFKFSRNVQTMTCHEGMNIIMH